MEWLLLKTLLSLAAVLGLMGLLVVLLRRYALAGRSVTGSTIEIEVLGRRALQPKQSVYVLRVMNRLLVVGVTDHGMQTLGEIADAKSLAAVDAKTAVRPRRGRQGSMEKTGLPDGLRAFSRLLQGAIQQSQKKSIQKQKSAQVVPIE